MLTLAPQENNKPPQLLRRLPHQRHNTIHHLLERLFILLGRIGRTLSFELGTVIPLDLKRGEDHAGVEAVDVVGGVGGETLELLY